MQGFWLVTSVYIVVEVGLSPLQLLLLGTVLEVTVLVAEIPTGVVADTVSRRWSLVLSMLLTAAAFVISGLAGSFAPLVVGKILWGIGWTFRSGADVAWITDELLARGADGAAVDRALTKKARWQQRGGAAGLVLFGLLGWLASLSTAMIVAGALMVALAVWIMVLFTEQGFSPQRHDRLAESLRILRSGVGLVRGNRVIVNVLGATLLFNLGAEAMDRLTELRLIELGLPGEVSPVLFFTGLGVVGLVAGAALLKVIDPHLEGEDGPRRLYGAFSILAAVGALIVAGAPAASIGAVGVFLARGLAWSALPIVSSIWVNRSTTSEARATVQSFLGQASAAGQIVGGLALGLVSSMAGVPAALVVSALLFAVSGLVILRGPKPAVVDPALG